MALLSTQFSANRTSNHFSETTSGKHSKAHDLYTTCQFHLVYTFCRKPNALCAVNSVSIMLQGNGPVLKLSPPLSAHHQNDINPFKFGKRLSFSACVI